MHIGIAAPINIHELVKLFDQNDLNTIPRGLGATPPTDIAKELIKRGERLSIFTLDLNIDDNIKLSNGNTDIYVGRYRRRGRDRGKDFFKLERDFVHHAILQASPDVVHSHWTYEFALGALSSGIPTLITAHDAPLKILALDFSPYRFIRMLMAWQVMRRAKYVATVSPYITEHLCKFFRYKNNITTIPNGIDDEIFTKYPTSANQQDNKFIFFSIANGWGKLKNEKKLIKAFSSVHLKQPNTELWMFGESHEKDGIVDQWATNKNLCDGVRFFGFIKNETIIDYLHKYANALIHPSLEESFGMILIEAMAVGIPVVGGTYSGAVPSTLGDGKAGLLVDVRSQSEITRAMLTLIKDREFAFQLGQSGKAFAYQNFRISQIVDRYQHAYKQTLEGKNFASLAYLE